MLQAAARFEAQNGTAPEQKPAPAALAGRIRRRPQGCAGDGVSSPDALAALASWLVKAKREKAPSQGQSQ